jgi:hypothetical protein
MALLLKHQTAAEFVARFREAYRNSDRERLVQLARFVLARIAAGDITDAQCRNAFGLNATQWTALKTKMTNLVTAANTVKSAVGE